MGLRGSDAARPWNTAFALGLAALGVILIIWAQEVLLLGFLGLLLGILLDAIAQFEMRWLKLPRTVAVVLAAVVFLIGLFGSLTLIAIPMVKEGSELLHSLPEKTAQLSRQLEKYRTEYPWLKHIIPSRTQAASNDTGPKPTEAAKKALVTVSSALELTATALATFFLGLFLAWNPERWRRGVAGLWANENTQRRISLFRKIGAALRSYLFTVGMAIIAMAVLWTLGLWIIGVDYPFLFGAIAGLVEVVPYVGPLLGLIPPLLYAIMLGPMKVLYVMILYAALHVVEGYVLVPYLMHERERLPPPLAVFSILCFGTLFGTLGVVLAVPLGTTAYIWVKERAYQRETPDPA